MKKITAIIISFAAMALLCTSVAAYSGGMLSPAMRILSEDETMIKSALVSGDITFSENDFYSCGWRRGQLHYNYRAPACLRRNIILRLDTGCAEPDDKLLLP